MRRNLIEPDSLLAQSKNCGGSMKTKEEELSFVGNCFHRSMPPHTANHSDNTVQLVFNYVVHPFDNRGYSAISSSQYRPFPSR